MRKLFFCFTAIIILFTGCTREPSDAPLSGRQAVIYPDFTDITIPSNIAPVNFRIQDTADKYITVFESGDTKTVIRGRDVLIPLRKWRAITSRGNIKVTVFEKHENGWIRMNPFPITVAEDIDSYLTYRLIMPSFQTFDRLTINQRNITNFKEKTIYANTMSSRDDGSQCINCHSFRNWSTETMQFHIRQYLGGTILYRNGKLAKLNLKTDSTIAAAVYPSWHPTHEYIAYSTNKTFQNIHTNHTDRMEAFDQESDLILFNMKDNSVSVIENDSTELECHPYWTPDGKTLFYVSAHIGNPTPFQAKGGAATGNASVKYSLYSKSFDPDSRTWGKSKMFFDAAALDSSITWPRVSPDGRWLICCINTHGVFPPYQSETELIMFDLEKGTHRYVDEINSDKSESYHSWSSNGHWLVFSTRREDGVYTRPYLTHLNDDGSITKPFPLPQKDPDFSVNFMYSFNIPEFSKDPIRVSARKLSSFINSTEAESVPYVSKRGK